MSGPLLAALERVQAAIEYVHDTTCPRRDSHRAMGCPARPSTMGTAAALDVLDAAPRDAAGARLALHDRCCASEHCDGVDHARRTQTSIAAALRRFRAQEATGAPPGTMVDGQETVTGDRLSSTDMTPEQQVAAFGMVVPETSPSSNGVYVHHPERNGWRRDDRITERTP